MSKKSSYTAEPMSLLEAKKAAARRVSLQRDPYGLDLLEAEDESATSSPAMSSSEVDAAGTGSRKQSMDRREEQVEGR